MNKQKGLVPLVIIILIATAIGGYLIYQKQSKTSSQPSPSPATSDETTNWKTYTNAKYGLSFEYPQKFARVVEFDYLDKSIDSRKYYQIRAIYCSSGNFEDANCKKARTVLQITIVPNPANLSLDKLLDTSPYYPFRKEVALCAQDDPRTQVIRGRLYGVNAVSFDYVMDEKTVANSCKGIYETAFYHAKGSFFLKNQYLFYISIIYYPEEVGAPLNQILSTVKFTQ